MSHPANDHYLESLHDSLPVAWVVKDNFGWFAVKLDDDVKAVADTLPGARSLAVEMVDNLEACMVMVSV